MLARIFLFALAIGLGVGAAQGPEFVQQYMQRLGGHVDELNDYVQRFDERATRQGYTRERALAEFDQPESPFVQAQGREVAMMLRRHEGLNVQQAALQAAGPFERMVVFARNYDPEIARAAFRSYSPAVPATAEGFLLGAAGFLFGYAAAEFLLGLGRRVVRRRRTV